MVRWQILLAPCALLALSACRQAEKPAATRPAGLAGLRVMQEQYPRAFFFRSSEGMARSVSVSYEEWEKTFERLTGIMGKALDEEIHSGSVPSMANSRSTNAEGTVEK